MNMLTDSVLRELLTYTSPAPVLSVYLNTDATEGTREALKLRLRTLLKGVDLPQDEAAILKYFELEREWTGRSVAMFSCASRDFFRAIPFAVPVRSRVYVGDHPYCKPLADLLDAYGGYSVALVDKQGARLFLFHIGELREQEGVLGEEVRHTKGGGASSMPGRMGGVAGRTHHEEEIVDRNLRDAATFAARFFEDNHVRRVLIGGTDDTVAQFRSHLPKAWQSLVVGSFAMSMGANHAEVQAKALEIGGQAERSRENRLVDQMITAAAKSSGGVVRLEDTLSAVHNGRVQTLIVREGLRARGWQCQGCGFITAEELETCPFCGKFFHKIPDAVELAVHQVMRKGGDVEIVRDNPHLQEIGIGALLRY
jgi:peptide subunit release factor 1 (eRF1)